MKRRFFQPWTLALLTTIAWGSWRDEGFAQTWTCPTFNCGEMGEGSGVWLYYGEQWNHDGCYGETQALYMDGVDLPNPINCPPEDPGMTTGHYCLASGAPIVQTTTSVPRFGKGHRLETFPPRIGSNFVSATPGPTGRFTLPTTPPVTVKIRFYRMKWTYDFRDYELNLGLEDYRATDIPATAPAGLAPTRISNKYFDFRHDVNNTPTNPNDDVPYRVILHERSGNHWKEPH
jgi:hypothetical protein